MLRLQRKTGKLGSVCDKGKGTCAAAHKIEALIGTCQTLMKGNNHYPIR